MTKSLATTVIMVVVMGGILTALVFKSLIILYALVGIAVVLWVTIYGLLK